MNRVSRCVTAVFILVAAAASVPVHAQSYPSKPVRLILPFPPGGPTDIVGRLTGQKLAEQIGQSVIADSRPGASGNIGLELTSKAPPEATRSC